MKTLLLIVMSFLIINCSSLAQQKATTVAEYRQGMENGALASTVVLGKQLCESLEATKDQCTEVKGLMVAVSLETVKRIPASELQHMLAKDSNYKSAMKQGSLVFTEKIGSILCRALRTSSEKCVAIQEEIKNNSFEFIDSMDNDAIDKLRQTSNVQDMVA